MSDMNQNGIEDGLDTQGVYGDTFFDKLWYIRSLGTLTNDSGVETIVGNDLNLLELYHNYMGYNYGENIIVQIVDTGVDADHEDLEAQYGSFTLLQQCNRRRPLRKQMPTEPE